MDSIGKDNLSTYAARRDRLRIRLEEHGLATLLVSSAANRYYLSGFELHDPQCNENAGMLLITAHGEDHLLTDSRYLDAARRLWPEDRIFIYPPPKLKHIRKFLASHAGGILGIEAPSVSLEFYQALTKDSGGPQVKPVNGLVEGLRLIKEPLEVEAMARSCALNHRMFEWIPEMLQPGMTEREAAWEIEKFYREGGAEELAFPSIVAVGPNGAMPHAVPGQDRILAEGPVLVDTGCRLDEYCSDQTRTFWVGDSPSKEFLSTREQVREAQALAVQAIRPGLTIAEPYALAKNCFAKYGVAEHFTHSLGHGIGLETHEGPSVGPNAKGEFVPGMVVTVEPGLYYPEWGGVRWEYMLLVTEDGARLL